MHQKSVEQHIERQGGKISTRREEGGGRAERERREREMGADGVQGEREGREGGSST